MTALLRRAVGRGEPLAAPSWLTAEPRITRQHRVPVALRVRQALEQEHADALGPAGAVGLGGERLAAAVGGEPALPAELDEHARRRHHGDAAGERQRAFALPQRLAGQVQRHERRAAGGVDGERGALQPERVGDATGRDAGGAAGADVALEAVGRAAQRAP